MANLLLDIKKRLTLGEGDASIRADLLSKGYLEEDVTLALSHATHSRSNLQKAHDLEGKRSHFWVKELFDRVSSGFASQQFLNILFFISGGSLFWIGIVNGLSSLLNTVVTSYQLFSQDVLKKVKTRVITWGLVSSIAYILFAVAINIKSPLLFAFVVIGGSLASVIHGNFYHELLNRHLKENKSMFLQKFSNLGIFISGLSLILGGFLLDKVVYGYVALFFAVCLSSIFSVISLMKLVEDDEKPDHKKNLAPFMMFWKSIFSETSVFFHHPALLILLITSAVTSFVHVLGFSYYGIYIYQNLSATGFGPFLNVAIIFVFALLGTYVGSFITQSNAREYGKFPMLVFGTILIAIMPITFFYNPNLVAMGMAAILGIVGSSIVGIARSILTVELVPTQNRTAYFRLSGIFATIPYILFIPFGAWYAETFYLRKLFLVLGLILMIIVVPLYLYILILYNKKNKI